MAVEVWQMSSSKGEASLEHPLIGLGECLDDFPRVVSAITLWTASKSAIAIAPKAPRLFMHLVVEPRLLQIGYFHARQLLTAFCTTRGNQEKCRR